MTVNFPAPWDLPDAPVDVIRAACMRLLSEPQFRDAAKRLGDLVAADAEHSSLVEELEAVAATSGSAAA